LDWNLEKHIYTIKEISNIIAPIAESYGVGCLSLFGSYARGEANENSDIDLRIVERGSLLGLFRLAGFHLDLEEILNAHVDVLPTDSLSEDFLNEIRNEEIIVYGNRYRQA
jgi:predicted nucleotidyltransferase